MRLCAHPTVSTENVCPPASTEDGGRESQEEEERAGQLTKTTICGFISNLLFDVKSAHCNKFDNQG